MTVVDARTDLWRSLVGRGPDHPTPADPSLWQAVVDRLNPAKARPTLRVGVEEVAHTSDRGGTYVMLASPERLAAYVRLAPEEVELAHLMDGRRTVAQLVGEFARATGRLAPDQVTRVVADLAGARMLDELPVDAFAPLVGLRRRPWPLRVGRGMLAFASGRRVVLANPDRLAGFAYRVGGRLLFTRAGVAVMALVSLWGLGLFARTWAGGAQQATVADGSYAWGAVLLLALNVVGLLVHEAGHALGVKHAGRRARAVGIMCYFGIPSAYVDTTDMWMADRRRRLIATAAGPGFAITFAGLVQVVALWQPSLAPLAFPLGFAWYLNSLFNLNPLMALDGYYLVMDWLEVPNLRPRAVALIVSTVRHPSRLRASRRGEDVLVARYALLALLWMVAFTAVMARTYKDRISGLVAGLWQAGLGGRVLLVFFLALIASPLVYTLGAWVVGRPAAVADRLRQRHRQGDEPRRRAALQASRLGGLDDAVLAELAAEARWLRVRRGSEVLAAGAAVPGVVVVVDGALEARRPGDPSGSLRGRAGPGDVVGASSALADCPSSLSWTAVGTRLLSVPAAVFARVVGSAPAAVDRAEVDTLLDTAPALAALLPEERAVLAGSLTPTDLAPGRRFRLSGAFVALVGAGTIEADGTEVRAGGLVGPPGGEALDAEARSRARVWPFAVQGALAHCLGGATVAPATAASAAPAAGMHGDHYGPLVLPWGSPPVADPDGDADLARRFRRLLLWLLLLVAFLVWLAFPPGTTWAETPDDSAILEVTAGTVDAVVDGEPRVLTDGDRILVRRGDEVAPRRKSVGRLLFRGGAEALICPRADARLGVLHSTAAEPVAVWADIELDRGRILADTASTSSAFQPLSLQVALVHDQQVTNDGEAVFAAGARAAVQEGVVRLDGEVVAPDGEAPTCGGGIGLSGSATDRDDDDEARGRTDGTTDGDSTTTSTNSDGTTTTTDGTDTTDTTLDGTTTTTTQGDDTTTTTSGSTTTTTTTVPNTPPRIVRFLGSPASIGQLGRTCTGPTTSQIVAEVQDDDDPRSSLTVRFRYVLSSDPSVQGLVTMHLSGSTFVGTLGPFARGSVPVPGGTLNLTAFATDPHGASATPVTTTVVLGRC